MLVNSSICSFCAEAVVWSNGGGDVVDVHDPAILPWYTVLTRGGTPMMPLVSMKPSSSSSQSGVSLVTVAADAAIGSYNNVNQGLGKFIM